MPFFKAVFKLIEEEIEEDNNKQCLANFKKRSFCPNFKSVQIRLLSNNIAHHSIFKKCLHTITQYQECPDPDQYQTSYQITLDQCLV